MTVQPKRLVIFGINYAPELTGIAPYTTELAEHFAAQGHRVRVVTGVPHYPQWRRLPAPPRDGVKNPSVSRYQHFIPRRANALGRMTYEVTWLLSASRALGRLGADAVIGIVPSLSGGFLALAGGRRWHAPVGLVVKDLMGPAAAQSGYRGGDGVAAATRMLEGYVVRHADRVAYISEGFRPYLLEAGVPPTRLHPVRDWTHPGQPTESVAACRTRLGWQLTDFICLHAGNMGQKQGLDNVLYAASILRNDPIKFVLSGDGNDRARLTERARRLQLKNVSFLPLQPAGQYEAMLSSADILLLNQRASVGEMSLPSKLASYLASGRPVIGAVAERSPTAREITNSCAGIVVAPEDPAALAQALLAVERSPDSRATLGARGKEYAKRCLTPASALANYDSLLAHLLERHAHNAKESGDSVSLGDNGSDTVG